mmetsp:Transcript_3507/g.10789  ORF Transcript_3507/g.10789 Transcript_3507/m.10789 type:complete len:350 (+) Transcript_3507:231-1280(+)
MPQDEFDDMCKRWLEATKDQVEGLTDEQKKEMNPAFIGYEFESDHRPWHVTKQMKVPDNIPKPEYHETGDPVSERAIKANRTSTIPINTPEDMDKMREVCAIGREVLDITSRFLKAGVTADELDRVCFMACMERGGYPSPLNYNKFPKSLCVSVNEVICHGIPDCRPVQVGDIVNLDISVFKDGYHSDLNETFMIGKCDEAAENLVRTAYESLAVVVPQIMPGTLYRELGNDISRTAHKAGCAVTRTYSGHGIGKDFHGLPNVSHVARNKTIGIMRESHIFTVEPMINEKGWQDNLWPDNWTAVTRDGRRSAQFEHTFMVTETGVEILTARPGTSRTEIMPYDPEVFRR